MMRMTLLLVVLVHVPAAVAQTPLLWLTASSDTVIDRDGALVEPSLPVVEDAGPAVLLWPGPLPASANLDGLHEVGDGTLLLSVDSWCQVGELLFGPADVVRWGNGRFSIVLDAEAVGLPDGVNVDAVSADGSDLLVSFDTSVTIDSIAFDDEDLLRWDGVTFTLALDGSAEGVPEALDLDAAARLENGHLLLSFDGSGEIDGVVFDDEDVLEHQQHWVVHHDASEDLGPAWTAANLDALSVGQGVPPRAGTLRFVDDAYWVDEATGTLRLKVARVGGRNGAIRVSWSTSDGTATAPADYRSASGQLVWPDGDAADKSITLTIVDNHLVEEEEAFVVSLSAPSGGAMLGAVPVAAVYISDDEDADLVVNHLGDVGDPAPGDGRCGVNAASCTLRAAVEEANAQSGLRVIGFAVAGTITVTAPVVVSDSLLVRGPGADDLVMTGAGASRILEIDVSGQDGTVALSGLTLRDGFASGNGGAVLLTRGGLDVTECKLIDNTAALGSGGAIYVAEDPQLAEGRAVRLRQSLLSENHADLGGALAARGHHWRLGFTSCTVRDNEAQTSGGAVFVETAGGPQPPVQIELIASSFVGNQAIAGAGGGLYLSGAEAELTVCTLAENRARHSSAGALLAADASSVVVSSCTVADNHAASAAGVSCGPASTVVLRNSVLARNAPTSCGGVVTSDGSNLDDDGSCALAGAGDLSSVDPQISPIVEHLGTVLTVPLPFSPAVDSTIAGACTKADGSPLTRDQRGYVRPEDGNDDTVVLCDRGAVERGPLQGDLDLDGVRDAGDLVELIRLLDDPAYAPHGSGDCTDDGTHTTADLACLAAVISMR